LVVARLEQEGRLVWQVAEAAIRIAHAYADAKYRCSIIAAAPSRRGVDMIVDCAHYLDGARQSDAAISLEDAALHCLQGGFVWLGLFEPSREEMNRVREAFALHELAVEDARTFHLRPKIEDFEPNVKLVILRTARYDDAREEVDFGEISVFVSPNFVITVRQGVASELHAARTRLEQHPELLELGTDSVLWAILDQVVRMYGPVVAELEHDIEEIEGTVFSGTVAPTERIYLLRREVTNFYRAAHPLLAVLATAERNVDAAALVPYLRDVHDSLQLINEEVSAQRDLLATILQANIAVIAVEQTRVSVRQSHTIELLTILATIFLPLTFVTGFFGQNFDWLVGNITGLTKFIVLGIGGLVIPLALLWAWLRRTRATSDRATGPAPFIPPGTDTTPPSAT
jgi:magnesium transporter